MLGAFRRVSQSWIAKLLFVPLIAGFAIWGIGDVLRLRAATQPALVVGDERFAAQAVVDEFRRDVERMSPMFKGKLTIEMARQMGLMGQTLQRLIAQSLLDQGAQGLGLVADDDTLYKSIAEVSAFHGADGKFSRDAYTQVLRNNGFTEQRFEDAQRHDIVRAELSGTITAGASLPTALVDPLFRYREERRIAEIIRYPADAFAPPAVPDDAVLEAFVKDHADMFTAPETRDLSTIVVTVADAVAGIKPSDEEISKYYQDHLADYSKSETRAIHQALFSDKAAADALVEAVKQGKSFDEAAGKSSTDLGNVERKDLPFPELADAAFGAQVPGIAGPVQSPLGWHVLYVSSASTGGATPLAQVRDAIATAVAKDKAADEVYTLSTKIEDQIGSGASLADAAKALQLKTIKAAGVDQGGRGPDGKPIPDLPDSQAFRIAAFQTAEGATSEVQALDNDAGYFVLRVDKVTPPALKPFAAVRDQAVAAWKLDQQDKMAMDAATKAALRLNQGEPAATVAAGAQLVTTDPFPREGNDAVAGNVAALMFKVQPGAAGALTAPVGAVAARLKEIVPADPAKESPAYAKLRDALNQDLAGDLDRIYVAALERQFGVTVRQSLIDQQLSAGPQQQ